MTDQSSPIPPDYVHPKTPEETGFFFPKSGEPIPPTHPDHGPMDRLPRQEDGSFAAYYYCSKSELDAAGADAPPPRRHRHDGWTAWRMDAFIETLRATASVTDACRAVGMSRTSAYKLYHRPDAAHFRKAWDEALRGCTAVLAATAFDRAVNGTEEAVFWQGEHVGWRTRHDNRHLQWMLRVRDPLNWAPIGDLEAWLRHRGIEDRDDREAAARLAEAEAQWGRRLPGEEEAERLNPPRHGEGDQPKAGGGGSKFAKTLLTRKPPPSA